MTSTNKRPPASTIGRSAVNDLVLTDERVSAHHVRVRPDGGWQVLRLPLPDLQGQTGSLRVAVSAADARARYLGFAAELRR